MSRINRRFAAKLAAAAGATLLAPRLLIAADVPAPDVPAHDPPARDGAPLLAPSDKMLEMARQSLSSFMFAEQHTQTFDDLQLGKELVITSATRDGKAEAVYLRSRSARVFRADATVDEFTKQGGVHWRIGKTAGKTQLATPGAVILAIRDDTTTVRWYTLTLDLRC